MYLFFIYWITERLLVTNNDLKIMAPLRMKSFLKHHQF
jgi:hypothetical protein